MNDELCATKVLGRLEVAPALIRRVLIGLAIAFTLLPSCVVFKSAESRKALKIKHEVEHSTVFAKSFTGFTLLDPATGKTLVEVNGDHYFTPASNTKILTLATCLEVLGDSVPGIQYAYTARNELFVRGTGDPTFLHPNFAAWQPILPWIKKQKKPLVFSWEKIPRFGPGWAWDDYNEPYSTERSAFPMYGNLILLKKEKGIWKTVPACFSSGSISFSLPVYPIGDGILRNEFKNQYTNYTAAKPDSTFRDSFSQYIPMPINSLHGNYLSEILKDTMGKNPGVDFDEFDSMKANTPWHTLYSTPTDTVLRRMMHQSDNFIAEQMLLVCAGVKFDTLQSEPIINWMLDSVFATLPQRPRWVDGSGLSRYNLNTPNSIAQVLLMLWKTQPKARLFSLFPTGGVSGTLEHLYCGKDGEPYVFAKSGSMGGVYCLSGYIVSTQGKVLIFTFMNNNFVGSNRPWKAEIQRILEMLREY